jgi:preprotein translocase subunit Sec61beta
MAKGKSKKGEGFHSAAGLIRYFDAEDETAMKIDPRAVIGLAVASVIVVEVFKLIYPS